jgi:2-polyprenyl-6-methoxyphenol hydroxylase-like FAD-dependent oxidoreductase
MKTSKDLPFIIAGGGIGGLCAALALAKSGIHVKVLERAPEVGEIGFGIQIAPNGYAMLERLGVAAALDPYSFYPDALILVDAMNGEELTRINLGDRFQARYKHRYFVIHRRDLHGVLLDACRRQETLVLEEGGKEVTDYEDHGDRVTVNCADGSSYEGRAMIGVEGLRSPTRARIVPDQGPRPSGHVVYRGLTKIEDIHDKSYINSMVIYGGPGCHAVQYRLRGGTVMNNVATIVSPSFRHGQTDYGGTDELFAAFEKCAANVRELTGYLSLDRKWALHDLQPATNWTSGNVTLLGDAAHATLQYLAQGAVMAMEDAVVLASELGKHGDDVNAAFMAYQAQRLNRTARVTTTARLFGEIIHASEGARLLRNELVRKRDMDHPWEIDWLYRGL